MPPKYCSSDQLVFALRAHRFNENTRIKLGSLQVTMSKFEQFCSFLLSSVGNLIVMACFLPASLRPLDPASKLSVQTTANTQTKQHTRRLQQQQQNGRLRGHHMPLSLSSRCKHGSAYSVKSGFDYFQRHRIHWNKIIVKLAPE